MTKGKNGCNRGKWDRIEVGDVTLFLAKKRILATGVTTHKFINKELALHLWDKDDSGETWELIYSISEIKDQDIPQSVVNDLLGYDPKYVIQGFNVLDETKSENFLSSFELISELYQPTYTPEQHIEKYVGKSPERRTETQARLEQSSLRKILLKGASKAKCAVCGNEFPEQFLVAAHIKKRANCTDEEKRDHHNIACLMCKFGCDDLYERGAIGIASGTVVIVVSKHSTFALSGFFAFNHDVNGSSLSSSCLCRACYHTGRWVDWISQPAIKNFIVTPLAQFFCLLKAVIQGCSHPTTLHRICFLALRAKNSK